MLHKKHVWIKKGKFYLTKKEIEPLKNIKYNEFKIKLRNHNIKFKKPKYSPEICINKNKTYSIQIYAPIRISYKNNIT